MQQMMFHPAGKNANEDSVSRNLLKISQYIFILVLGLLPVLFIPTSFVAFGFSKILIVVAAVSLSLIFFVLSTLREGHLGLVFSPGLLALWGVAVVAVISALFSGDFTDAFSGTNFGTGTAAFIILLALVATVTTILKHSKRLVMLLYILIALSAILLMLYHAIRVVFGAEFLSLGLFTSVVDSPLGAWNDVALFAGLAVILALIALEQLPLTKWGHWLLAGLVILSLSILAVVNFFAVWLVLAGVSLILMMYSLTKHRFRSTDVKTSDTSNIVSVVLSILIFITSVTFLIGGGAIGNWVSNSFGVSYVQVTPSLGATIDVARSVYADNAIVGIGPNKFVDAWRLHKDPSINQTIFWATPFEAGSGYTTTNLVTMGILGALAWLVFFGLLIFTGVRMLFASTFGDRFWYFVATSSFVAALYLWGMTFIYVPSVTMLLLAAVCTGLVFTVSGILLPARALVISMSTDRRMGFVLVAVVMLIIVGSVSATYFTGRQYAAVYGFSQALASTGEGVTLESIEQKLAQSFELIGNDLFARQIALLQLARLNTLLSLTEPSQEQIDQFEAAMVFGVNYSQLAIDNDPTEPLNYQVLGQIYSLLVPAKMEGAYERSAAAYANARRFDPHNPALVLLEAQLEVRAGDIEIAQQKAEAAIAMKRDYTEALLFLADIDIAQNNIEQAVTRTQSVIALEPNNPARYYQLGVLLAALENADAAISAFNRVISLDPNHANARYLLALQLVDQGEIQSALQHLNVVAELNPNNTDLATVINSLKTTGALPVNSEAAVTEPETVQSDEGQVTTTKDPDTPLITPVNSIPESNTSEDSTE